MVALYQVAIGVFDRLNDPVGNVTGVGQDHKGLVVVVNLVKLGLRGVVGDGKGLDLQIAQV